MSLRARLLAGMVALVAAGLAVAAFVTYEEQRSFLLTRVDQQALSALGPLSTQLRLEQSGAATASRTRPPPPFGTAVRDGRRRPTFLPPGTFGELRTPTGRILRSRTFSYGASATPAPKLPPRVPLSRPAASPQPFTVSAGNGVSYRAVAVAAGGDTAIVGVPLREAEQTLHRLVVVEALVGAGVILALVLLGWVVIRVGLRPLERIGTVASEIAGGTLSLSERVEPSNQRTEVGRLGLSFNEMLTRIEGAFEDRRESEDRLRRFLADASHELRTPLSSIRGYAELFRWGAAGDPATLARAMSRIEAEAARMGVLVEDLLLLAQLDQIPEPRRVPVDLRELVEHAAADTRVTAPDREVTAPEDDGPAPMVLGDPDQLRQLLGNLTRNAVIHTPPGSPIELRLRRDDARARAVLEVRDHGSGLPPEADERVFDRFWRAESGRSRGRGGAGLGLAIVRAIVLAHGGEVSAENVDGDGACFRIELPLVPFDRSQQSLRLLSADPH